VDCGPSTVDQTASKVEERWQIVSFCNLPVKQTPFMTIRFYGAARTVTGSKHLITLDNGKNILLDCGFFQGHGADTDGMNRNFLFDISKVDVMVLSHAHIDHSGNIPNLVKQGYKGKIFCTEPTRDLCTIMLADTAHIQENDASYINKRRHKKGLPPLKPIYSVQDAEQALKHFVPIPLNKKTKILEDVMLEFSDSGHILGAAAVHLTIRENGKETTVFFSGDIGRPEDKILKKPAPFGQADYILCESTYGNRTHDSPSMTESRLIDIVYKTCVEKKGKLIIPAFSLGRTQELVYALNNLSNRHKLPHIRVFVDSPLSVNATEIMRNHASSLNRTIRESLRSDPDPFGFNELTYIRDAADSKRLNELKEPCIIISASGMAEAGRIKHHLKNNISDARNTILIVGFCTPDSLGGRLVAGSERVRIFGEEYPVNAAVEVINSFSAHADYKEMLEYLSCQDKSRVKKIFLVHGEYSVQLDWQKILQSQGYKQVEIPEHMIPYPLN